jgi:hypothetical protein
MKTVVKVKCTCNHKQQDEMYGSQVRVANLTQKGSGNETTRVYRCTVCSTEHSIKVK